MTKFKTFLTSIVIPLIVLFAVSRSHAQTDYSPDFLLKSYRGTATRINDLVYTKLDVRFDYKKRYLYGKEWVTLKPHFYATDSLRLDAKGMDLKMVSIVKNGKNVPLKYTYDNFTAAIKLDRVYQSNEKYTLYIDYTAKPDELALKGSVAITGAKGLYFINPDGTDKNKPIQIWTQGETEAASAWFPTIDKTAQKCTDEITMTVPAKYVTLSNGYLASQKSNNDGTRTDTWKMELPHSPYLFMMAVGDFKIYHDKWRNKQLDYYLEPAYAPYAKEIFGMTPEAMEFYSKTLGVDFPWNKYAQIVVRDYVSGSMENTTATLHGQQVEQTHRELIDANYNFPRQSIVHELFHQWFGDYVTAKSWSNLTVNESFANFSEIMWAEHKFGKDAADDLNNNHMQVYFNQPGGDKLNLVRFHYNDANDMFDGVTYQKGGRILNMLRNYLGYDAFYKGLGIYLKTNAFKTGEPQKLRLALEESSGRDLNWFFNQWYYGSGHPLLNISYKWDEGAKKETVYLEQPQQGQIFKLPFAIDIYAAGKKVRHKVWMNDKADTLTFPAASKPDLVNVDGDKVLLAVKNDTKTLPEYEFQYFNAPLYMDRLEAINAAAKSQADKSAQKILIAALKDKYFGLRVNAINALDVKNDYIRVTALPILVSLAQTDENTVSRAAAISALSVLKSPDHLNLFKQALSSQSYAVQAAALTGINALDPAQAFVIAKGFEKDNKGPLTLAVIKVYSTSGNDAQWPFVYNEFTKAQGTVAFTQIRFFSALTSRINNPQYAMQGISALKNAGITYKQFGVVPLVVTLLNNVKEGRAKMNDNSGVKAADDAITDLNDANK